jgi:hypothetical protein
MPSGRKSNLMGEAIAPCTNIEKKSPSSCTRLRRGNGVGSVPARSLMLLQAMGVSTRRTGRVVVIRTSLHSCGWVDSMVVVWLEHSRCRWTLWQWCALVWVNPKRPLYARGERERHSSIVTPVRPGFFADANTRARRRGNTGEFD